MFKILSICLIVTSLACKATDSIGYRFSHIGTEDGLSQNMVISTIQDSKGYMWFGTFNGINRFDGNNVKQYGREGDSLGLNSLLITKLFIDTHNTLWVGTANGLGFYNDTLDIFTLLPTAIDLGLIHDILEYSTDSLIISASSGLYTYSHKKHCLEKLLMPSEHANLETTEFYNLYRSELGGIYFTYGYSFLHLTLPSMQLTEIGATAAHVSRTHARERFRSSSQDQDGNIWLGTFNGKVYQFDCHSHSFVNVPAFSGESICNSVFCESDTTVLFSFDYKGIIRYNVNTQQKTVLYDLESERKQIGNNKIWGIYIDNQNTLWLGHNHLGVSYSSLNDSRFTGIDFTGTRSDVFPVVSSVLEDHDGFIWVGTDGGGIIKYNRHMERVATYRNTPDPTSLPDNAVLSLLQTQNGDIWVGTYSGGLAKYLPQTDSFKSYKHSDDDTVSISRNDVRSIVEDEQGNLWMAVHGEGVSFFDSRTEIFHNYNSVFDITDAQNLWTFDVDLGMDGNLWVLTGNVLQFDPHDESLLSLTSGEKELLAMKNSLFHIAHTASNGVTWFCSDNGVFVYDTVSESLKPIVQLPAHSYLSIAEDAKGNIWLGSNKGLYSYDLHNGAVSVFMKTDGLPAGEFVRGSSYSRDGTTLYFGTVSGFFFFKPSDLDIKHDPPAVELQSIEVMGKQLAPYVLLSNEKLTLAHDENFINISYTAINFINPETNQYRYKLEGLEHEWKLPTVNTEAVYTSLPPGQYTFKVQAASRDGAWSPEPKTFSFSVLPPWWATWWFRLLSVLVLAGIAGLIHFYRLARITQQKKSLERKVIARTQELHTANSFLQDMNVEINAQNESLLNKQLQIEKQTQSIIVQKSEIEEQAEEITLVNEQLQKKQTELEDSLRYAQKIQEFMSPAIHGLANVFSDAFLFHRQKDIVSGDFFWCKSIGDFTIFSVADCTGHGVPGAMLSMVGINLLEELTKNEQVIQKLSASDILEKLRMLLKRRLVHTSNSKFASDGMDIALCIHQKGTDYVSFAGANNPLYLCRNGELQVIKPTKNPIGMHYRETPFVETTVSIQKEDMLYLFSDGYADQFGIVNGKKLKSRAFKDLLNGIAKLPVTSQEKSLHVFLDKWMGNGEQIDDIMVLGIRV